MGMYLEENEKAKDINKMSLSFKMPKSTPKKSSQQTLVDRILEVTGQDPKKYYGFWCLKSSQKGLPMNVVLNLCDTAEKLPAKYSKVGYLIKRL